MKAIVIDHYAHPSKQPVTNQASEPKPAADEVLVEVHSACAIVHPSTSERSLIHMRLHSALNFFDILQAQGKYQNQPPFPFVLGAEFAGTIAASSPIPKGCPFKRGDRVFGSGQGAYAERVAAKWQNLHPIPNGFSFEQAAGLFVTWPTRCVIIGDSSQHFSSRLSYEALVGRAQLQPGEWCLVHAAAGGVGLAAVQIAKALGAKVIATAGTQDKLKVCKTFGGADEVLDYTKSGWQKEVLKLTNGKGVDVIYDPVGLIKDSLKCIAWKVPARVGRWLRGRRNREKNDVGHVPSVWKALFELFESGKVKPVVFSEVYQGLEQVSVGLEALEQRKTWGKAIVQIKPGPKIAKL
ncbi:NAD-P-binding protein [Rhizoctonia solani]|uniref:NAD-P-binding protein n=1 Tax=Rhizoctonia solani TaxID=456999 RepID=A0A8H7IED2_9AGAM|nr:NAD-P-binding protein [Rhizoctonia solani]